VWQRKLLMFWQVKGETGDQIPTSPYKSLRGYAPNVVKPPTRPQGGSPPNNASVGSKPLTVGLWGSFLTDFLTVRLLFPFSTNWKSSLYFKKGEFCSTYWRGSICMCYWNSSVGSFVSSHLFILSNHFYQYGLIDLIYSLGL
jgi:hypothetical protein